MKENDEDVDIQNNIKTLLIERKTLRISIKRLKNQLDNDGLSNGLLSSRSITDTLTNNKNKSKEYSDWTSSGPVADLREAKGEEVEVEVEDDDLEKRPRVSDDVETKDRHKRLLRTGLFNHLKRAMEALTSEKSDENIIKHIEKDKLIDDKLEEKRKIQLDNITKDNEEQLKNNEERLIEVNNLLSEQYTLLMVCFIPILDVS